MREIEYEFSDQTPFFSYNLAIYSYPLFYFHSTNLVRW